MDDIFKLKLHEYCQPDEDTQVLRVPGGWIYHFDNLDCDRISAVFVPFDIEYQKTPDTKEDSKNSADATTNTTKATICPECGGEVIINKPSGNGFCIQCDYKVSGKL